MDRSGGPATAEAGCQEISDFIVDVATDEVLRLNLDKFEGPLEVLLYLIKAQEIDIFDIPILQITDQYLRFLDLIREEDLDVAGEYLVMAATLIQIKSKMLLPVEMDDDEEVIDDGDPRLELFEKLIAYRKFKDVAHRLSDMEEQRMGWFTRIVKPDISGVQDDEDGDDLIEVGLYDLIQAFKSIMRFLAEDVPHTVETEEASVDQKIEYIMDLITERGSVAWIDLFEGARSRVEMVCCFLAILELCRMGDVAAHQHRIFGDIRLFRKVQVNVA